MVYRVLGKTNLRVSVLGLGGGSLARIRKPQAINLIKQALDLGINIFDTHRYYGDSEEKIGLAIGNRRNNCIFCTKFQALQKGVVTRELEGSLKALKTERIDIYLLKDLNNDVILKEFLSARGTIAVIEKARQQGKIGYLGFSSKNIDLAVKAVRAFPFDVIEVPFNPIKDEAIKELIPLAKQKGIGIIIIQPFAGGALCFPPKLNGLTRLIYYFLKNPIHTASSLNKISNLSKDIRPKLKPSQMRPFTCLRYIFRYEDINTVVCGMSSVRHLQENINSINLIFDNN